MSWLNIKKEDLQTEIENADNFTPGELPAPGVIAVIIESAYLRTYDSGAISFNAEFKLADESSFTWTSFVQSGEEKGNKNTYTDKKGNERPLPGVVDVARLFGVLGIDMNETQPTDGIMELWGQTEKVKIFKDLIGKQLQVGLKHEENEYLGEVSMRPLIVAFMDKEGIYKGEDIREKITKQIEKNPIKKLKKKASQNDSASSVKSW